MGADGHIQIWRDETVRAQFPDCDQLFACLPTHYADELDGVKYHHCYWGDNLWSDWTDQHEWYTDKDSPDRERLTEFVTWLEKNGTHWEVWT